MKPFIPDSTQNLDQHIESSQRKQNQLIPTTIRDLINASDQDEIEELYGLPFEYAIIVGTIKEIQHDINIVKMLLDDLTGILDVQINKKDEELPSFMNNQIQQQSWVKARIGVKTLKNQKLYILYQLTLIQSFDEVTLHIGQVTIVKSKQKKDSQRENKSINLQSKTSKSNFESPQKHIHLSKNAQNDKQHLKVLNAIKILNKSNNGVTKQQIYNLFQKKMDMPRLENNLDILMDEFQIVYDGNSLYIPI